MYKIHVFPYSKRENTKAATFKEQVVPEVKEKRAKKVIELSEKIQKEYNKSYIGKNVKVLVEEKEGEYYKGHTKNYIYVLIKDVKEDIENKIVEIIVEDARNEWLIGSVKVDF